MNRLVLTTSLVVIAGLLITSTSTLPLDFEVHRQPTYYDLIFPKHDTPLPTWDIPVKRFLTEPLHCCTDHLYDIPALFSSVKHRTFLIHYLYELRGNMHREISQATKNGTPTTLARFVPELTIRIYRLEENMFILYPHLRDQIMNRETGINGVQNEFEYSLVMFHNLLDLLNQIKERENITEIPVESLPEQGDLPKYLFTKEMNEKMDKDRRGLLSAWERMNPVEQCFDMTQRGLFCIAHVHGIETSIATQAPTTRRMSYFHKYQRKPRGRQPRRG